MSMIHMEPDTCKNIINYHYMEYDGDDVARVVALFTVLNGFMMLYFLWNSWEQIKKFVYDFSVRVIGHSLYWVSVFEVKYIIYLKDYVDEFKKHTDVLNTLLYPESELQVCVKMKIFFQDGTLVVLDEDDISRFDVSMYMHQQDDIAVILVEKYTDDDCDICCAVYHDLTCVSDLIMGRCDYPDKSSAAFMSTSVNIDNSTFEVDLSTPINYCMVGNNILGEGFVRYILETQCSYVHKKGSVYNVYVMDNDINELMLYPTGFIRILKDGYEVEQ